MIKKTTRILLWIIGRFHFTLIFVTPFSFTTHLWSNFQKWSDCSFL